MANVFDVLKERGYIEQVTHEEEVKNLLENEKVTFYIGFDPTADSLHVGHFIQVMVMMHMQRHGHIPIALIGGGTAKIGDPSGKNDMRKMMTNETIINNGKAMKAQMGKYLDLDGVKGHFVNNADWLDNLNYISFLREIGSKFSVNRMLAAECFKQRLESGLTFLEFNYMIMQAYDFLELNRRLNCKMQLGGNDQWSNIIAGTNLIRKAEEGDAYGLTFKLLVTSEGKKMGKTEKGAIWLDPEKTSPYEMFQYFRNVDDADVENCLALLTFLPMDEVRRLGRLEGSEINTAKEILAFEFTKIVHGEEEATKARDAARALFSGDQDSEDIPSTEYEEDKLNEGIDVLTVLMDIGFAGSRGEGKRLIKQGGLYINGNALEDFDFKIDQKTFEDGKIIIRKGKKTYHQIKTK